MQAVLAMFLPPLILQVQLLDSSFVEEDKTKKKKKKKKRERECLPQDAVLLPGFISKGNL